MSLRLPAIVVCGDVDAVVSQGLGVLVSRLRRDLPGVPVMVVPDLCEPSRPSDGSSPAGGAAVPRRVVVGCAQASDRGQHAVARLRAAGVADATVTVDLRPAEGSDVAGRLAQILALFRAAVAFVRSSDPDVPLRERTVLSAGRVSRVRLFRGDLERRPVAVWLKDRCGSHVSCGACALACPHGALNRAGGGIAVLAERCTGCGVCVATCPDQAFVLGGASLDAYGAAAAELVDEVGRGGSAIGIALVCRDSAAGPLIGDPWLGLRVPSLEMVSAGWLLQLMNAGAAVRVIGCEDPRCRARGEVIDRFVTDLGAAVALSGMTPGCPATPPRSSPGVRPPGLPAVPIDLAEPTATLDALQGLGALDAGRTGWHVAGPGCPLGVIEIDSAGCSACEACVGNCPTGALMSERDGGHTLRLSVDAGRCTACSACVRSCPESVIAVRREAGGRRLTAGRRVVATVASASCSACGGPLLSGLSQAVMAARLGGLHPAVSGRTATICPDCRIGCR